MLIELIIERYGESLTNHTVRGAGGDELTYACAVDELSEAELDALIDEATVDAYGEDEELTGFAVMIGDNLAVPFETTVLGIAVTAEKSTRPLPVSSRSANAAGTGRRSRSSTSRCLTRPCKAPSGLRPTGAGQGRRTCG